MGIGETGTTTVLNEFTKGVDVDAMAGEILALRGRNAELNKTLETSSYPKVSIENSKLNKTIVTLQSHNRQMGDANMSLRKTITFLEVKVARLESGDYSVPKDEPTVVPFKKVKKQRASMSKKARKNIGRGMRKARRLRERAKLMEKVIAKPTRKKPTRVTPEIHKEIMELTGAGFNQREIADHVGVSTFSVSEWARKPLANQGGQITLDRIFETANATG